MILIGESINDSIPKTATAIAKRDRAYIQQLAIMQTQYGANYLDICAGTNPSTEKDSLLWLIHTVQEVVDTPLCIDSINCSLILELLPFIKIPGIINSVNADDKKCDTIFKEVAGSSWKIIGLACDEKGISAYPSVRLQCATKIVEKANGYGIDHDRILIDPLVTTLSTANNTLLCFMEAASLIKERFPAVHITSGVSNISYGMPCRNLVNQQFMIMAMNTGMDSAILNLLSDDMRAALYAANALLGKDRHCRDFLKAYRKGMFGSVGSN